MAVATTLAKISMNGFEELQKHPEAVQFPLNEMIFQIRSELQL